MELATLDFNGFDGFLNVFTKNNIYKIEKCLC